MAKLFDSLNYASKFDFIDSDDEDYVEKTIMKNALSKDSNPTSVRNAAAHTMAQKGKPLHVGEMDKTLNRTKTAMQVQLDELKDQMSKLDQQHEQLQGVSGPEEALEFMKNSGMSEADMGKLMELAGKNLSTEEQKETVKAVLNRTVPETPDVNEAVNEVEDVAKKISKLQEAVDSDDDDEGEEATRNAANPAPTFGTTNLNQSENADGENTDCTNSKVDIEQLANATGRNPEAQKKLDNFNKAISQQKEQRALYETKDLKKNPEENIMTPSHTVSYTDNAFELEVALPLVESMSTVDLQASSARLKLSTTEGYVLELDWKQPIDDATLKCKFKKKTKMLKLEGLLL